MTGQFKKLILLIDLHSLWGRLCNITKCLNHAVPACKRVKRMVTEHLNLIIWSNNSKIKILKINNFSGVLEWLWIWIVLLLLFCVLWGRVKNSVSIYFLRCNRWINSSSIKLKIKQKIQKMNRQPLVKNLGGFHKTPDDNLKK